MNFSRMGIFFSFLALQISSHTRQNNSNGILLQDLLIVEAMTLTNMIKINILTVVLLYVHI